MAEARDVRVGIDIGGTFTDLLVYDPSRQRFFIGKTLTTPDDPSRAVADGVAVALADAEIPASRVRQVIHGTTLITNALIERRGADTALLTTAGFRDAVAIGREHRYDLYDIFLEMPEPLVRRRWRLEVDERVLVDGAVERPVDPDQVRALARELREGGIEAAAVCLLHSYRFPEHERQVAEILRQELPGLVVSLSSDVVPEIKEYDRASTTICNVYVRPVVDRYLGRLGQTLSDLGIGGSLFIMLSSGGTATVDTARRYPIRLVESGPAAGALAAAEFGRAIDEPNLLSFDMGGTTAKACVIDDGEPLTSSEFEVARVYRFKKGSGFPVKVPVIEMIEIGAGGGSIASVDQLGLLRVGPRSAGAAPGPVCYGRGGTEPTVTDADLVLGYLDPDYFLGGAMRLDREAARAAIVNEVAEPLGLDPIAAAWGIHQLVNENMASAARVHAVERGKDPRRYPIFAFGGAGPVHAYRVARILRSPKLIVPAGAGVTSTIGFLAAPLAFDFVRSTIQQLEQIDWSEINGLFGAMEADGLELLRGAGVPDTEIRVSRSVDLRYVGQGHEVNVPVRLGLLDQSSVDEVQCEFDRVYTQLYGRVAPGNPIESVNWRVVVSGRRPEVPLARLGHQTASSPGQAVKGTRPIYAPEAGDFVEATVYDRYALQPGQRIAGPAVVEERESTFILGPGAAAVLDNVLNIVVDLVE